MSEVQAISFHSTDSFFIIRPYLGKKTDKRSFLPQSFTCKEHRVSRRVNWLFNIYYDKNFDWTTDVSVFIDSKLCLRPSFNFVNTHVLQGV